MEPTPATESRLRAATIIDEESSLCEIAPPEKRRRKNKDGPRLAMAACEESPE